MPNGNLKREVKCPNCGESRMARVDVIKKLLSASRPLICKPCHNRMRFEQKNHPRKGTGVKNDPDLLRTRSSYYKAKRRSKMGSEHHLCYSDVEFRFESLEQFIDCVGIRPIGMTLDRIDPLGHYEAGNVRWATPFEQAKNRLPRGYWQKTR
jgi:predicted RNA-binding Zn-ribbon protein involved in translation (DUF1610 family)